MPKYNSIDTIPTKVFFDILQSKDYQQLKPKPKEKGLEDIFMSIYDDYFVKMNNAEAKRYLQLRNEIALLKLKISQIKLSCAYYFENRAFMINSVGIEEADNLFNEFLDALDFVVDRTKSFIDIIHQITTIEIGYLNNDLAMLEIEFEEINKKSSNKFDYYEVIGTMSNHLPNNSLLKEDMTLAVYVALYKQIEKQKK